MNIAAIILFCFTCSNKPATVETIYRDKTIKIEKTVSIHYNLNKGQVIIDGIAFKIMDELVPLKYSVLALRLKNIETGSIHLLNHYSFDDAILIMVTTEKGDYPNISVRIDKK